MPEVNNLFSEEELLRQTCIYFQYHRSSFHSRFGCVQKNSLQSQSKTDSSSGGSRHPVDMCPGPPDICPVNCGHSAECTVDQWSTGVADRRWTQASWTPQSWLLLYQPTHCCGLPFLPFYTMLYFLCFTLKMTQSVPKGKTLPSKHFIQVFQCVAMNVTLIYSLLAYSSIKQRDFSGVYVSFVDVNIANYLKHLCVCFPLPPDGAAETSICSCVATSLLFHCLLHCLVRSPVNLLISHPNVLSTFAKVLRLLFRILIAGLYLFCWLWFRMW